MEGETSNRIYHKTVFCADLDIGDEVYEVFCVSRIDRRIGRQGPYLTLEFVDRSGRILGVAWNDADTLTEVLVEGAYARVRGRITRYRDRPQIDVTEAEPAPSALEVAEYLAIGPIPGAESIAAIRELASSLSDPHLRRLIGAFLNDPDFARAFAVAPAAKINHHAYVGGLAEHTRSVMDLCALAAEHYTDLDRDLLLTGAFLHDIGKVGELTVAPGFPFTEEGMLLGHIPLGFAMARERFTQIPDFPSSRATDLGHLILSHQGELEWGSPVEPQTLEALVLHFLDNLDSKVGTARPHLADVYRGRTRYVKSLGRALFRRGILSPPRNQDMGVSPPQVNEEPGDGRRGDPSLFEELDRLSD